MMDLKETYFAMWRYEFDFSVTLSRDYKSGPANSSRYVLTLTSIETHGMGFIRVEYGVTATKGTRLSEVPIFVCQ